MTRGILPLTPCIKQKGILPLTPYVKQKGILPLTPCIKQKGILPLTPYVKQKGILPLTPYVKQKGILYMTPYVKQKGNAMKRNLQKIQMKEKNTPQMTSRGVTPYMKASTNGGSKGGTPFRMTTTMTWTSTIKSSGGMCLADKVVQAKIIDILISLFFI
jgi:hypothetical protein